ncbi:EscF/YscF/HrpA family type III secretion system needle major subunit [Candidatus Regiella insecticola]|uniref:EscF/YscF/HrpA family type III secretion system needle major subunit n=1 Tax=Candidatus Regiella insecticola TaxID=138073 RepID=UPI0002F48549|nr:EscF/YscF/HrpA family type III secretion system needle major subunit [Candidatus Regiella insecticola]
MNLDHAVKGLLNNTNVSMEQFGKRIANVDASDPKAQLEIQNLSRLMVAKTEFTSSIIKMLRDLVRSIISKISA